MTSPAHPIIRRLHGNTKCNAPRFRLPPLLGCHYSPHPAMMAHEATREGTCASVCAHGLCEIQLTLGTLAPERLLQFGERFEHLCTRHVPVLWVLRGLIIFWATVFIIASWKDDALGPFRSHRKNYINYPIHRNISGEQVMCIVCSFYINVLFKI